MHYFYLQKLWLKNYSKNSETFQLFDIVYEFQFLGCQYVNNQLQISKKYTDQIHHYLKTHDNCFTLIPGGIKEHFLTILIHKNSEGIHICYR